MKKNRMSDRYLKMSEVYSIFASSWKAVLDFSEQSRIDMYHYETYGTPLENSTVNGYYVGKQWMDVVIKMWFEDIENRLLTKHELYQDQTFPRWWLDKILA